MFPSLDDPQNLDVSIDAPAINRPRIDQEMGSTRAKPTTAELLQENESHRTFPHLNRLALLRKVLAEAFGSFVLVFNICAIIGSMEIMEGQIGLLEYATTAALTVMVLVYSIGTISGAHVNPAITLAFAIVGPFPWSTVPLYLAAQLGGSVLATFAGKFVYGLKIDLVLTQPFHGRSAAAFSVEFIATTVIVFLAAALSNASESVQNFSGFVVGGAIGLGVLITGPISGASMNPARSLGPAIVSGDFTSLWIYLIAPTIGAIFGGFLYRIIRLQGWSCHHPKS